MKKFVYLYSIFILQFTGMSLISPGVSAQTIKKDKGNFSNNFHTLSIGDKIPASLWTKIPKKKTTGLVILDFWRSSCASCLQAFPKMESLQKQFDEKLQVVMMNPWENEQQINERMDKISANLKKLEPYRILKTMPIIIDTVFKSLFAITSVPVHVWVDAGGTILYITYNYNATPQKVTAVLNGERLSPLEASDIMSKEVKQKGFLQPSISEEAPLYYSAFIPSGRYIFFGGSTLIDTIRGIWRNQQWGDVLFYIKKAFDENNKRQRVVLEMAEKEKFEEPDDENLLDDWYRKYCFTYEIQLPLKDKDSWQTKMQIDVNDFFGRIFGIEGVLEKRKFNSLVLVKTKDGLLKTAGAKRHYESRNDFISYSNVAFKNFVSHLYKLEDMNTGRPFSDESGVDPELKIDIELTGDQKDVENVRKQIKKYGLDIITCEREVEVLVIKDQKDHKQ